MNAGKQAGDLGRRQNGGVLLGTGSGRYGPTVDHDSEPTSVSRERGNGSIAHKAQQIRFDLPASISRSRSQSLGWLLFSRLVIPLTALMGFGMLIPQIRFWLKPRVETDAIVYAIRSGGEARWQAIGQIATLLSDDRYLELRKNPELAEALSEAFREELRRPFRDQSDLSVISRKYLCYVLQQFDEELVIPALCEAAVWWGAPTPQVGSPVRRAAIEGLFEIGNRLGPHVLRKSPEFIPALNTAAADPIDPVRAAAALTLGMHGGPEACETLESLLNDPVLNVRYSAAIGLGMAGSPAGLPVLSELFWSDEAEHPTATGNTESISASRTCRLIFLGLCSVESLMDRRPDVEIEIVRPAVHHFCQSHAPHHVKEAAFRVQRKMERRSGLEKGRLAGEQDHF
ncbi:MAG: HEAT repeat domain-containing protein [Thermogutta sp.]